MSKKGHVEDEEPSDEAASTSVKNGDSSIDEDADPPSTVPFSDIEDLDVNAWADGFLEWIKRNFKRERD